MSTGFGGGEYFEALGKTLGVVVEKCHDIHALFKRVTTFDCDHPMLRIVLLYFLLYTSTVIKVISPIY